MVQAATKKGRSGRNLAKTIQIKRFKGIILIFLIVTTLIYIAQLFINPIAERLINHQIDSFFGKMLKIESVRVSLWRGALITKGVRLIQPPGYGTGNLLTTEKLEMRINLIALLNKELAFSSIILKSPRISLSQTANSHLNTEYYLKMFKAKTNSSASNKQSKFTFHLNRFRIDKGEFLLNSYRLSRRQPTFKGNNINFELNNICLPNLNKNSSSFTLSGLITSGRPAKFQIKGRSVLTAELLNFQAQSNLEGLELADYAYLFPESTINVNSGKVWVYGDTNCANNYIVSKQHATIQDLKIKAKKGGILGATFLGLPATAITKIIANKGRLNFDFTVEGYSNELKTNPKEIISSAVSKGLRAKFGGGISKSGQVVGDGVKKVGTGIKNSLKKVFKFKK